MAEQGSVRRRRGAVPVGSGRASSGSEVCFSTICLGDMSSGSLSVTQFVDAYSGWGQGGIDLCQENIPCHTMAEVQVLLTEKLHHAGTLCVRTMAPSPGDLLLAHSPKLAMSRTSVYR